MSSRATILLGLSLITAGFGSAAASPHYVATWGTSPAPQLGAPARMEKAHLVFHDQTLREIVRTSIGGSRVRVRFSNVFGREPLAIGAASLQVRGAAERALTFRGERSITIPVNAEVVSDPVPVELPPAADAVVNLYFPGPAAGAGIHYSASQMSMVQAGDQTANPHWPAEGQRVGYWAFLEGIDVEAPASAGAIVALGDSITDGAHSTTDANRRWPDDLARRLLASGAAAERGVVNAGIGGNRILFDGTRVEFGVNALNRLDRDVLAVPGVRYVLVLEGINDIGHGGTSAPASQIVTADQLIAGLAQVIERAHEHGLKVFVGTLTPFEGAGSGYYTPEKETVRQAYNAWIRSSPAIDGVVDFDRATRDPAHPGRFLPAYDSGDHLHPNDAGYQAMAEAVPLSWFGR